MCSAVNSLGKIQNDANPSLAVVKANMMNVVSIYSANSSIVENVVWDKVSLFKVRIVISKQNLEHLTGSQNTDYRPCVCMIEEHFYEPCRSFVLMLM